MLFGMGTKPKIQLMLLSAALPACSMVSCPAHVREMAVPARLALCSTGEREGCGLVLPAVYMPTSQIKQNGPSESLCGS